MVMLAPLACFCLMVVGVILYQIDARAAGGFLHPSSSVMAESSCSGAGESSV